MIQLTNKLANLKHNNSIKCCRLKIVTNRKLINLIERIQRAVLNTWKQDKQAQDYSGSVVWAKVTTTCEQGMNSVIFFQPQEDLIPSS